MDNLIGPILAQAPMVALALYLMNRFKAWQDESRDRFLAYLRERDKGMKDSLNCVSESHQEVGREIKGLAVAVAKLETRMPRG
jgi:hypothetical protein